MTLIYETSAFRLLCIGIRPKHFHEAALLTQQGQRARHLSIIHVTVTIHEEKIISAENIPDVRNSNELSTFK